MESAILPASRRRLAPTLEQGKESDIECRMIRADGSHGWLTVRASPRYGADGQIIGLARHGRGHNQSARMPRPRPSRPRRNSKLLLRRCQAWSGHPCLTAGSTGSTPASPNFPGIPAEEMKPNGWAPVHPDDVEAATTTLAGGPGLPSEPFTTEYRIRRYDGMYRWHITRAIPIRGADGAVTHWIGTSADIQDQKSSEQALAELNATLEQQVRERTAELLAAEATLRQSQKMEAVGQLTGGLAHDFNNLLAAVSGSLELLAKRIDQGQVTGLERYLSIAQVAAKRAAALTHRLLAFSRRQTLDPKPIDINQLVDGMDDLIRRTVGPAVTVKVTAADGLWAVLADPNQLENALLNLCINARDAMPDGGDLAIETGNRMLEESEARELELQGGEYVSLSVSDTGGGMTADVIARAFDPFFTTKPIGEGTGLGLSMVYGFVRQSGGQARIQSEPGHGAKISLYLPRYMGGDQIFQQQPAAQKAQHGNGETVLLVDDERSVRMLVTEVLNELGYTVLEAENGAAGLQILESRRQVDLLITDVGLPGGMNGRQLADAARVTRPNLKILFITGYAEHAVMGEGNLKPGMHILTKPFSLENPRATHKRDYRAELGWKLAIRAIVPHIRAAPQGRISGSSLKRFNTFRS